jgi:hypothetical protein
MQSCLIMSHNSGCTAGINCGTYAAIPYFILFMIADNSICINLFHQPSSSSITGLG